MTIARRIGIILILLFAILGLGLYGYKYIKEGKKISNKTYEKLMENIDELVNNTTVRDEKNFASDIHQMANTLIIAEDGQIRGLIDISEEKCNAMIVEAMASNYTHKERYLEILKRWKDNDFKSGVEDHNFVWEYLGGVIGRAIELNFN